MRAWSAAIALCTALALAACGGSSHTATTWQSLRRVRVTVAQPGLPPPYGQPKTTSYSTPAELTRVTAALNNFHISELVPPTSSGACAGGFQIEIAIVPQHGRTVSLSGYRCANHTSGGIGGNLAGFLSSLGLPGA